MIRTYCPGFCFDFQSCCLSVSNAIVQTIKNTVATTKDSPLAQMTFVILLASEIAIARYRRPMPRIENMRLSCIAVLESVVAVPPCAILPRGEYSG